jgi:hypothetical protein
MIVFHTSNKFSFILTCLLTGGAGFGLIKSSWDFFLFNESIVLARPKTLLGFCNEFREPIIIQTLVNSFSNLMNNGIFVIPTTPKSLPVRRTRPANVYTGVTENILDVMSRIWNQSSLFSANTIG